MNYDYVVFDLDGTLIETSPKYILQIVNGTLMSIGSSEVSEQKALEFWFCQDPDSFVLDNFKVPLETYWERFRQLDTPERRLAAIRPYDDVVSLQRLTEHNIKLGVLTSAPKYLAEIELALLNLPFQVVINAQPCYGLQRKPHPEGMYVAKKTFGGRGCFVGNGIEDMLCARNAAVTGYFVLRQEYPYKLPEGIAFRFSTLHEIIDKILEGLPQPYDCPSSMGMSLPPDL